MKHQLNIPKDSVNPETGMLFRNPSHADIAEEAEDQSEIVKFLNETGRVKERIAFTYEDLGNIQGLPGMLEIQEMDRETLEEFFKTMLRVKPNILDVYINLGTYPDRQRHSSRSITLLNANKQRTIEETASRFAEVFSDSNIVEFRYRIQNLSPGHFRTEASAMVTNDTAYGDKKLFKPEVSIEYIAP